MFSLETKKNNKYICLIFLIVIIITYVKPKTYKHNKNK